jgi:predicted metalloendopeptidase
VLGAGGLKTAFHAFQAAKDKEARTRHITDDVIRETFDGLTNDQLFFVSYAQLWYVVQRPPPPPVHRALHAR